MILYHVSDRIDRVEEKTFTPKIPDSVPANGEDTVTPRICFAPNIRKCVEAIGLATDMQEYITVYQLDTDTIDAKYIVPPDVLQSKGLVFDAARNCEYWVLCPVVLNPKYFKITDAVWELESDGVSQKLAVFDIEEVEYSTINNPIAPALAAMLGIEQ